MKTSIPKPKRAWRFGLFSKMTLVLAPVFLLVAALGVWILAAQTALEAEDNLTTRMGSAAGRVSSALERHARVSKSANPWADPLPMELLNTLMSDQAIRCVVFTRADDVGTTLSVPRGLGCVSKGIEARFKVPLFTGVDSTLEIGFDRSGIRELRNAWYALSSLFVVCGLFLSVGAAWLGFRIFISKPLLSLLKSIQYTEETGKPFAITVNRNDELGVVMSSFNAMQESVGEKTRLLESERAQSALILDSMMDGLLVIGRDTRIIMANAAAEKLLALPQATLVGMSVFDLFRSVSSSGQDLGLVQSVEALRPDGISTPVLVSVALMTSNEVATTVCVVRNVSNILEHERHLQQATIEAMAANRAKTEFLANVSHELRTPLNAIIGFSEIMKSGMVRGRGEEVYIDYAKDINQSGMHLLELVNDILDISKVAAGEVVFSENTFGLNEVFVPVRRLLGPRAAEEGVKMEFINPNEDQLIVTDQLRLKQILINLVSNAIKFTPEGGKVSVEAFYECGAWTIQVSDTGIGMTEAGIVEAMKPFRQVDNSHTRSYEGTGLGLPLSKGLVEGQGGCLEITSIPGDGTQVKVIFPAREVLQEMMVG